MFKINFGNRFAGHKKILIIDNDRNLQSILKTRLIHAGFEVDCAGSTDEAVEKLRKAQPRLILTEIVGNEIDGFAFLKLIRDIKSMKSVSILIMSTEKENESIERALNLGACGYIIKPFHPGTLIERIKKEMNGK